MQARYFSFHKRLNTLGRMTHTARDEMGGPGDPRHEVGNEDPNLGVTGHPCWTNDSSFPRDRASEPLHPQGWLKATVFPSLVNSLTGI